ncbi:MAG: hypothetical protein C0410_01440 [Anaerolinea sp.]|nr:hypothetical protein [Anaerolinea sp.]
MSYQEKKTLASITSGALLLAAYCLYAFNPARTPADLKEWAVTMLVFIAIGVGATVIIQIVFHILFSIGVAIQGKIQNREFDDKDIEKNIKLEMVEDERDKLIEMKSNQVGFGVAGFGFIAALVALVLNYSPAVMINILFITFSLGSVCEGIYQFILYRRGYSHA